ncbi:MAG: hypothetical protein WB614_15730, partial [Pseudolabrys sp.]
ALHLTSLQRHRKSPIVRGNWPMSCSSDERNGEPFADYAPNLSMKSGFLISRRLNMRTAKC